MVRTIGYVLGSLMLVRGMIRLADPRFGFGWWRSTLRPYLPSFMNETAAEYSGLSDRALRLIDAWTAMVGILMLVLASRARD